MSHCHLNLNVSLRICSQTPDFDLAGNKLMTPYVGRSLMRPLTPPPPRSLTPPSLFPASEVFEDIPQGFDATEAFEYASQDHGKSVFLLDRKSYIFFTGTGAFLRDPSICNNLEDFCIWVGFNLTYERGSYLKRTGYTPLYGRFHGCAGNEIVVVVSDHRTSQHCPRIIQLHHLLPASPVKKGDYVVILYGDLQGHVTEVIQCQRKEQKVKIIINNKRLAYGFAQVCRLTQVP